MSKKEARWLREVNGTFDQQTHNLYDQLFKLLYRKRKNTQNVKKAYLS
jgi:hypothetical protein